MPTSRGTATLALLGDTMLGRGLAERLDRGVPPESLVAPEIVVLMASADLRLLNLECCISERGERWPSPGKAFFFRAPPAAINLLRHLRIDAVTLANNHALDYGPEALSDTLGLLDAAGIVHVGAGGDLFEARAPAFMDAGGLRLAIIGFADHPADFAAAPDRPGIAHADLRRGLPPWVTDAVGSAAATADLVLVTPHWGPNMRAEPLPAVRTAAEALVAAGASLVAGHSAHVFQGVGGNVLYDLGDFIDDYAIDPLLRNDLGLLWLLTVETGGPTRLEAIPLRLEHCHTRLARGEEVAWIRHRFTAACAGLGTLARQHDEHLAIEWPQASEEPVPAR
jgi:poly-gamma-glutamate synthesis protein (capsule biosynthesis protein)